MHKKLIGSLLLSLAAIAVLVFASCNAGESARLVFDANNLDENWEGVSRNSRITLENMDPSVMYAVKTRGGSRTLHRAAVDSSNIFKGNENTYIPIPDNNYKSSFTANDVHIYGSGSVQIVKLRDGSDDMTIREAEDPVSFYNSEGEAVYEEYYHIDFTQEPYSSLDKSRISLLVYGLGSGSGGSNWGYVTIDAGGIRPAGYTAGLYDFSSFDSINLYNTMAIAHSSSPHSQELIITNPIRCELGKPQKIPSKYGVFSIGPATVGTNYVLEIDKEPGLYYDDDFNLRYVNGDFDSFAFSVHTSESKDVYFLGEIDKELLCDVWLYIGGYSGSDFGSITFREATEEEISEYQSHFFTIKDDTTVFNLRLAPKDYSEHEFIAISGDGKLLNNMYITAEYTYDNGEYIEGYCETYLRNSHFYGVGHGGTALTGAYVEYPLTSGSILEIFKVRALDTEPVNVKITFKRSDSEVTDDSSWRSICDLFVVPNNGQEISHELIKHYEYYTVPELVRPGYSYRGMYYSGRLYKSGEKIQIENVHSAIIAAWDPL